MAKGIIYAMSTVVPGLVKIGKTGSDSFEDRMYNLERNGYSNVTGLSREFAIEVDEYDEKEKLLINIFEKSRVGMTELFAVDLNLVIKLLSSFEGKQVYPKEKSKDEVFDDAVKESELASEINKIPDGIYYLERNVQGFGKVSGKAKVEDSTFTVLKGSVCAPASSESVPTTRKDAWIENDILMEDVPCSSPSSAGWVVLGRSNNGWIEWENEKGEKIAIYRKSSD